MSELTTERKLLDTLDSTKLVRIASIPSGHPYVRHLADPDGAADVVRLPDPTDPWWPPAMLHAEWVRLHPHDFDVMHVHFGFDGFAPADLSAVCDALDAAGKPLVVTVHDLRNPHHETPELHAAQLGVLVSRAAAVLTLTDWAAHRIQTSYGIRAEVVPHPHIVELDELRLRQSMPRRASDVVGLHLKSVRPNMELRVLDAAAAAVQRVSDATLRVDVHTDVASVSGARHDPVLMQRIERAVAGGSVELHVHDFFDDDEFTDYIAGLRVSVLPYRFGTHSGWLETCRDLGVAVVAPDCGAYAAQGAGHVYGCNEIDGFDAASCEQAIEAALRAPRPQPMPWLERWQQRTAIAIRHRELYVALIS